jgi:hypothetical protein
LPLIPASGAPRWKDSREMGFFLASETQFL